MGWEAGRYSVAIPDLHDLTVSKRCMGTIADEAAGKVNLADPLSVRDIESLHEVLEVSHVWIEHWPEPHCFAPTLELDGATSSMAVAFELTKTQKVSYFMQTWSFTFTRQCMRR